MIDYGTAPAADEAEVVVFGPGFGEAIAVHLGEQNWMLVDSCIDPYSKQPAAQTYLNAIGVNADSVHSILASHWHDDHVRGLARLATAYPGAELNLSSVFNNNEARTFLATFSGNAAPRLTRGTHELFQAVGSREIAYQVHHRHIVAERNLVTSGRLVRAVALSPLPAAVAISLARMASYLPQQQDQPIDHAPELPPNLEAVAVHIDWGDDAVLLGSDLEDHPQYGWRVLTADAWCSARRRAGAYKVAHHGSATGDHPDIWQVLLTPDPIVCLTPFNLGSQKLPTSGDKERIREHTSLAFIASATSSKPMMDSEKLKRLGQICTHLSPTNAGFGAVRLRKRLGAATWNVTLFGSARPLQ